MFIRTKYGFLSEKELFLFDDEVSAQKFIDRNKIIVDRIFKYFVDDRHMIYSEIDCNVVNHF